MLYTKEKVKKYFSQVFDIEKRLEKLKTRMDYLELQLIKITTKNKDEIKASIQKLEKEITQEKSRLLEIEMMVFTSSQGTPPLHAALMKWRYICRFGWPIISKKSSYSIAHLMREHNKALENIAYSYSFNLLEER
ncbi:MAG: hypothetical protein FWC69_05570 [Defluviitaleaceae bacterium]|nr:hypothetical protein [Defluviitaleaceae bacterium]